MGEGVVKSLRRGRASSSGNFFPKLSMPRLGTVLNRPRLLKQCDELLKQHKLLWVAAPAGSGKSTLVVDYLANSKRNCLWYQVDSTDLDIASFFNNLATAVERGSRLRRKLMRFTPEYALGLPAFSRNFFREVYARLKVPACIAFDNYQEVGDDAVLDSVLAYALDELPEGVSLIVISRMALPAALARFDSNGDVAYLDAADLNLTEEEEAAIVELTLGSQQLSPGNLAQLHNATHGWVAGLLLALREIRDRAKGEENEVIDALVQEPSQDPVRVFGYFATEILARLDPSTSKFLSAAALLPGMTASLCERLTANPKAKNILQRLANDHFFTTRRGILRPVYEFHPLFRQFLLARGESDIEHQEWQGYKRRAGQLLAEAGESAPAATLLVDTQDWSALAELVKKHGAELEKQGRFEVLRQWLEALPAEVREGDPWLLYWAAAAQMAANIHAAYDLYERAYRLFRKQGDASGLYQSWLGASFTLYMRLDDMQPAHYWVEELEWLRAQHPHWPSLEVQGRITLAAINTLMLAKPESPEFFEWLASAERIYHFVPNSTLRCFVAAQLGIYHAGYGKVKKQESLTQNLRSYVEMPRLPAFARLLANYLLMTYAWQSGNRTESEEAIARGQALLEDSGFTLTAQAFYLGMALTRLTYEDYEKAGEIIVRLRPDDSQQRGMAAMCDFLDGWLCLRRKQYHQARVYLESSRDAFAEMANIHLLQVPLGGLVQVFIELGEYESAEQELAVMRNASEQLCNAWFSVFYCNYLHAYLLDRAGGDQQLMLQALKSSFQAAARQRWIVQSCWDHRLMARLCALALQHNIEPEYARGLIRLYQLLPTGEGEFIEQWPRPVRVYTLQEFTLQVDGQPLLAEARSQKKPLELLKMIIALGGRDVPYAHVLESLWPEADGDAASRNFNITLHRLRQLIGTDSILYSEQRLTLNRSRVWVDLWQLDHELREMESMFSHNSTIDLARRLDSLIMRYQRPFLDGEEADWALNRRERLRHKLLRVIESVCEVLLQQGDFALVLRSCQRGLEMEPLAEHLYRLQMKCQLALGELAAAAITFKRCQENLRRGLGVEPSTATVSIYQQILQPQGISSTSLQ